VSEWEPLPYRDYKGIVADPALLGGKLAVRGTRFSVSFLLSCLAEGMTVEEIDMNRAARPVCDSPPRLERSELLTDARSL